MMASEKLFLRLLAGVISGGAGEAWLEAAEALGETPSAGFKDAGLSRLSAL